MAAIRKQLMGLGIGRPHHGTARLEHPSAPGIREVVGRRQAHDNGCGEP